MCYINRVVSAHKRNKKTGSEFFLRKNILIKKKVKKKKDDIKFPPKLFAEADAWLCVTCRRCFF